MSIFKWEASIPNSVICFKRSALKTQYYKGFFLGSNACPIDPQELDSLIEIIISFAMDIGDTRCGNYSIEKMDIEKLWMLNAPCGSMILVEDDLDTIIEILLEVGSNYV